MEIDSGMKKNSDDDGYNADCWNKKELKKEGKKGRGGKTRHITSQHLVTALVTDMGTPAMAK